MSSLIQRAAAYALWLCVATAVLYGSVFHLADNLDAILTAVFAGGR